MSFPTADRVDIMLLLEGTFPYVSGGVSSWVNQIIRGFPEYSFGIVFLGSQAQDYGDPKYTLPDNVKHLEVHYIHGAKHTPPVRRVQGDPQVYQEVSRLHDYFRAPDGQSDQAAAFERLVHELLPDGKLNLESFLYSECAWKYITSQYTEHSTDPSFVDYFWTVRAMHQPVWMLAELAEKLIPARAYHSVSTGYAGFLGALLKRKTQRPLLLSEHGIYTKERKIDLFQNDWVKDNRTLMDRDPTEMSYFRQMWIRFFEALGRLCYDASDQIVALYEANRLRQIHDGAREERTRNIPNGIHLARLAALRDLRPKEIPPVLCLIGRVVSIKDVKTYIRAMRLVVNRLPGAEGWIAGPEDEDEEYATECKQLVSSMGLANHVKFLGFQKIDDLMPRIGLVVLSSISEALPLVLLEGFAAGVPAVATDVGSCRQLIHGLSREDEALGASGAVVGIADPEGLAREAIKLLSDPEAWHAAQQAGIARVERFYTQDMMFDAYRSLYRDALAQGEGH